MPANEQAQLIAKNLKLQQQVRRMAAQELKDAAKIRELEALVRKYRQEKLKWYRRRRDMNEVVRACCVGAVLAIGAQAVSYAMWELWQWLQGIAI